MRTDTFQRINGKKKNIVAAIAIIIATAMFLSVSLAWFADKLSSTFDIESGGFAKLEVSLDGTILGSDALRNGNVPVIDTVGSLLAGEQTNTIRVVNTDSKRKARFRLNFGIVSKSGTTAAAFQDQIGVTVMDSGGNQFSDIANQVNLDNYGIMGELNGGESATFTVSFLAATTDVSGNFSLNMGIQQFGATGSIHSIKNSDDFASLLAGQKVNGKLLEDGDTIVLLTDVPVSAELSSAHVFNLALCGHSLILNKDLNITVSSGYFGTMDLASDNSVREEFGRKGDIAGTGSVAITAPNVAVRCVNGDFTWGGRAVRLLNGKSDTGKEANSAQSLFMMRALPMSRNYADIQITRDFVGQGTAQNPYLITSLSDYKKLESDINTAVVPDGYKGKYFRMAADLDFTRFTEIPPVGGNTVLVDEAAMNVFRGNFDGAGHQLIGMKINGGTHSNVGVFGAVDGATIKNLIKTGGYVASLGTNTGGLVGRASNGSKIYSCYQTAPVSGSQVEDTAGGIVGVCETGSKVSGCYNVGTVNKAFDATQIAEDEMAASVAREQESSVQIGVTGEDVYKRQLHHMG